MIDHVGYQEFHLVVHSMGGLTGLLLAHAHLDQVASFVDIEGNIAALEDCFISRQIVSHPHDDPAEFVASSSTGSADLLSGRIFRLHRIGPVTSNTDTPVVGPPGHFRGRVIRARPQVGRPSIESDGGTTGLGTWSKHLAGVDRGDRAG